MIRVLFFASLREQLDCARLELEIEDGLPISALVDVLVSQRGEAWREPLTQENIVRAVNQQVVTTDVALQPGDEVAFYPPVTGG
jgi:molybdopterin synthase sulfur carrier subunit